MSGKWVRGRLEPMLEDAREQTAPAFSAALVALLKNNSLVGVLISGLVSCGKLERKAGIKLSL